ncbi:phage integrase [Mycobacteroides abscessus subsp. abscessus]|uniref:tyrosine-type recombinase/integrase n=1 Tax=Mycobacteroides abscessus TaxID=36809 RepID=UPI00092CC147|nr:site-specific integrase [Mycobacteroides abscessus]SIE29530.1 phage integrase [Mycobacteroides abscessus subsp. abscessus]
MVGSVNESNGGGGALHLSTSTLNFAYKLTPAERFRRLSVVGVKLAVEEVVDLQRRNRRAGVEDRWRRSDGSPTARSGMGRRWLARYVDDQGGENTRSFDRKVDAQAFLNEITAAQTIGTYVAPKAGRITVRELHGKWLGTQGHLKETTVATRAFAWSGYVEGRWAAVAVADVQSSDIRAWVQQLAAGGAKPATIENALSVLRQILEMAVDDRRIPRNPCTGVKSPRRQHRARGNLTHQQVELLAREVGEYAVVVRFLAYTGLRWGEMAALRVESFDMLRRRVNIREAVAEVKGRVVWSSPKSHERRSVPFPAFLADPLAAIMIGKRRDDLVFTSPGGALLRVSTWRPRVFNMAVQRLQEADPAYPTVTPHDLRHTAASLSISAGANVKAVQTMLGHASAVLTLDTYADLFPDDLEQVSVALDAARMRSLAATADQLRTGK